METHTNFVADEINYFKDEIIDYTDKRTFCLLFLAAVFHDIGKPWAAVEDREGNKELHFPDHSKISAEIWKSMVAPHISISQDEMELVYDLILQHDLEIDKMKGNYLLLQLKRADASNHRNVNNNEIRKIIEYIQEVKRQRQRNNNILKSIVDLTIDFFVFLWYN